MSEPDGFEDLTLIHRVVLLGVVDLSVADETPAHAGEIRQAAATALEGVDGDVVGTPAEAEVARALNELEATGLLDGTRDETSATGKGRPRFGLGVDADVAVDALASDDRLGEAVSRVQAGQ